MEINDLVNGETKLLALIGNPVSHSISPKLHNTISNLLGKNLVYIPFCVKKDNLKEAIEGLKALNVVGFNITAPYKKEVMKYIDDNGRISFLMGAVNTVKNIDGRLYGYNTDGEGFVRGAKLESGIDFKGKKVTILGAGGAARAIAVKLATLNVSELNIVNRSIENAASIQNVINDNIKDIVKIYTYKDKEYENVINKSNVVINATTLGMASKINESPIKNAKILKKNQYIYDIIYSPRETLFQKQAKNIGCKTQNGLGMLFYQAIASYEIWTGYKFSDNETKDIYEKFMKLV